jgi:competence protein ComEC
LLEVLNPPADLFTGTESDIDNNSVVLRLSDGTVGFVLTGDIMGDAEWELLRHRADVRGTVIKVAHHGSDTSSTAEFLAVVKPQLAVISSGTGNRFGHPFASVLARLDGDIGAGNVLRTDEWGTIDFTTDGQKLWVKTGK